MHTKELKSDFFSAKTYRGSVRGEKRLVVRLIHRTGCHGGGHHRIRSSVGLLMLLLLLLRDRTYPRQVHIGTPSTRRRRTGRVEQSVGHVRLLVQERRGRRRRRPRFDILLLLMLLRLRRLCCGCRRRVRLMRRLLLLQRTRGEKKLT